MEQFYGERADEIAVQLAWHYEEAGIVDQARHYLRRAGEQAAAQSAHAEAVDYLRRALALTPAEDAAGRYGLLQTRERVYDLQGARQAQAEDLAALEELAASLADVQKQTEAALRRANYAEATGDYPGAIASAQAAIELAQAAHDRSNEARGQLIWGLALLRQGDYPTARAHLEQALALARETGTGRIEAESLRYLAEVAFRQGDFTQASACCDQALPLSREIGDRRIEAEVLNRLGTVLMGQADYGR